MTKKYAIAIAVTTAMLVAALVHAEERWHPVLTSNPPTLSDCTGACTLAPDSIDTRGRVTCTDANTGMSCTVTFHWAKRPRSPVCVFTGTSTGVIRQTSAPTTSAFTFTLSMGGPQSIDYICDHGAPMVMP